MVQKYKDLFHVRLDYDEAANEQPMGINLNLSEGPVKFEMRWYSAERREFQGNYIGQLVIFIFFISRLIGIIASCLTVGSKVYTKA